jgi:glycyl-tRNA synthetase
MAALIGRIIFHYRIAEVGEVFLANRAMAPQSLFSRLSSSTVVQSGCRAVAFGSLSNHRIIGLHGVDVRNVRMRSRAPHCRRNGSRAASAVAPGAVNSERPASLKASTSADSSGFLTFQDAISKLQEYWASVGCALWLPHNTEVGAGTMNPATFLRVLGPEPWNVAYAEPSIRPDDSRYGDNPNRVQRHTQFQVILKPDPGNPQELYLKSLEAIGIDTSAHDIRFVEDNWESPVLGAWGLGWEVWLDGMEVTQFTYFQQAGGKPLPVPAVEITYGLERIIMSLQGVDHFKDIVYAPGVTYGEMFLQNEYEMSVYNLDQADVEGQRDRFDLYEKEARKMLEQRLPVPAYDHLLKLSHTFNIMDARGAVGVTERAECFAVLRSLAREVTALWVARREEQDFPLGLVKPMKPQPSPVLADAPAKNERFVLEVGTEELPPEDLDGALEQLRASFSDMLERNTLSHTALSVEGTPRRLVVSVEDLVPRTSPQTDDVRGPPAKVAFKDGSLDQPSPALLGFCKKNGITVDDCRVEEDDKGTGYVWATITRAGRPTSEVLLDELPSILQGISFKKSMKWRSDQAFSRPVRWLFAMHGNCVLPVEFAGLVGGSATRLLRNSSPSPDAIMSGAEEHASILASSNIIVSVAERKDTIWEKVTMAAEGVGGVIPDSCRGDLLCEVANLVESPTVVIGSYEDKFLALPKDILVMVMRKHQRVLPCVQARIRRAASIFCDGSKRIN